MFRLLLDENLPAQLTSLLRAHGFDVIHVRDAGLRSTPDDKILAYAVEQDRVCVTLDHDLHRLLTETGAGSAIRDAAQERPTDCHQTAELIQTALHQIAARLTDRFAATVTPRKIRARRLPIRRSF